MNPDDVKQWMLTQGECEGLRCPRLVTLAATREDPAERECRGKAPCPFDDAAQERFASVCHEVAVEAVEEGYEVQEYALKVMEHRHEL